MIKNENELLIALGNKIREKRLEKGLSQKELSFSCDMEKSSLSRIENGKTNISISTLARLSKCLEVPISEIVPE